MSIGITEKRVLYDNPCAPIVKFSKTNAHTTDLDDFDDDDDMMDEQPASTINTDTQLNPALGESNGIGGVELTATTLVYFR